MAEGFDAIVVGTGQAGPSLAVRCAREGLRTAIIERRLVGGTCVNTGCIPTKTLVASARAAHVARHAADWGVRLDGAVRVDMAAVKARKDGVVRQSSESLTGWLRGQENLTLIEGHARFVGPRRLEVGDRTLEGTRVFVNVGGRASVPDLPGVAAVPYLTNTSMMGVDFLPEHLLIVGGSYIGLGFAQMYRRFGSAVTVCELSPRLIAREDDDVSAEIRRILEGEGVRVRTSAECLSLEPRGARVAARLSCTEGEPVVEGSHLLLAVGRRPNTDDLGLDAAGLATDPRGYVVVNDRLETTVPGVWALGDVNGRGAFTHTAYNDYEIVAANLFDGDTRRVTDRIPIYALFIDPPLGRVGMTEREARATGRPLLGATMAMTRVGRAREAGETQGFMKVVVDAESRRLMGAAILGLHGDEVVQALADLTYAGAPVDVMRRAVHIHPTVAELVPTLLGELRPLS